MNTIPSVSSTAPGTPAKMSGNPVLPGWYADPEIHFFAGRFTIYPTTSTVYEEQTYFEAWVSDDLTGWRNAGRILDFAGVPWSTNRAAWAPSAAFKNGMYYFYFSAGDGAGIGVATSSSPTGPFRDALGKPLVTDTAFGAQAIDAHAFVDDDGQAYLYFGGHGHAAAARLNADMVSLDGPVQEITLPGYVEGPFMVKRRGVYYFMWSEGGWGDDTYAVAYAKGAGPLGPFTRVGRVLENNPAVGNGAGHHSVLQLPGTDEWVMAYHRRPIGETHHNHRVTCLNMMRFDEDGDILPVTLTHEGVAAFKMDWLTGVAGG